MFLEAYMDDSASDWGDKRLHLAGYILTVREWANFSDAWKAILDASPSVPYFKMSEARAGNDESTKTTALANLIKSYAPLSLECSVSKADFETAFGSKTLHKLVSSPYFLCYFGAMTVLANHLALVPGGKVFPIDFIFDEQGSIIEMEAMQWHYVVKLAMPENITGFMGRNPRFEDDIKILPLQAADMLASTLRRNNDPFTSDHETTVLLDVIRAKNRHIEYAMTREQVTSMANKVSLVIDAMTEKGGLSE
jgi:hypothetical protein